MAVAVMIEPPEVNPVQRKIADSGAVEKHTVMKLGDANLVSASEGTGDVFGGILAIEKVTLDGSTTTSCHMNGVFDLQASAGGAITMGAKVTSSGANLIRTATASEVDEGKWIGYVEETTDASEVVRVRLRGG